MIEEALHIITDPAHVLAELVFICAEALFGVVVGAILVRRHDRKHHKGHTDSPQESESDSRGYVEHEGVFMHQAVAESLKPKMAFVVKRGRASVRVEIEGEHTHSIPNVIKRPDQTSATYGHTHLVTEYQAGHATARCWTLSGEEATPHG